jgi:hypothetical protein
VLNVERATTGYAPCRACDRVLSSTECSLRHGFAACLARHDRIFRFADDIYDSVAPGSRSVDNSRRVLVRHVLRAKALRSPISERLEGAVRRPLALGEARGPKRNKSPAGKFEGTLVQVHCPKKRNEAASKSLCLSRSRSLCLSRSQESAAAPLSLLSVSLRWRVQMPYSRSVRSSETATKGNVQEYTNRSCCLWLACH